MRGRTARMKRTSLQKDLFGLPEAVGVNNITVALLGGVILEEVKHLVQGGQGWSDATALLTKKDISLNDVVLAVGGGLYPLSDISMEHKSLNLFARMNLKLKSKGNPIEAFFQVMEKTIAVPGPLPAPLPSSSQAPPGPPSRSVLPLPSPSHTPPPVPPVPHFDHHQRYLELLSGVLLPSYPSPGSHLYQIIMIFLREFADKLPIHYISRCKSRVAIGQYLHECSEYRSKFPNETHSPFPTHSDALEMMLGIDEAIEPWRNYEVLRQSVAMELLASNHTNQEAVVEQANWKLELEDWLDELHHQVASFSSRMDRLLAAIPKKEHD